MPENPFPERMLELFRTIENTQDANQRLAAIMDLASTFANGHDTLDHEIIDELHEMVEQYETARLAYRHVAIRLGRVAMNVIQSSIEEGETVVSNPEAN